MRVDVQVEERAGPRLNEKARQPSLAPGKFTETNRTGSGPAALSGFMGYWTVTRAIPPMPIALAAARDRSMHRPLINGPRSEIRTRTDRPLALFVTVTWLPKR